MRTPENYDEWTESDVLNVFVWNNHYALLTNIDYAKRVFVFEMYDGDEYYRIDTKRMSWDDFYNAYQSHRTDIARIQ